MPQFLATRAVQWVTEHNVVRGKKGDRKILFGIFGKSFSCLVPGLHKLWYPGIRDRSTWSKFGAHGAHGDVFLFSNLGRCAENQNGNLRWHLPLGV